MADPTPARASPSSADTLPRRPWRPSTRRDVPRPPAAEPRGLARPAARPALGIALKLASTLAFTSSFAVVKLLAGRFPVGEIVFARSLFALAPLLAWLAWRGDVGGALRVNDPRAHLRRSLSGLGGMWLGFTGLATLPLPDATAISYAAPLVTVVLAALLLGEEVRAYRMTAVAAGFGGVLLMLSPHLSGAEGWRDGSARGALAAFGGACCVGFSFIQLRRMARTETPGSIVFVFCLACTAASLATAPLGWLAGAESLAWRLPDLPDAALLAALGLLGGTGQILMTTSYRYAEASTVAPFDYASMLWAVGLGLALFGEVPSPVVLAGAAIVMGAGVLVALRERALRAARA